MRCLFLQRMGYMTAHGGANKSNRMLLEALAKKGHACGVLIPDSVSFVPATSNDAIRAELLKHGITPQTDSPDRLTFVYNGVFVYSVKSKSDTDEQARQEQVQGCVADFRPDCIVVSSEDRRQLLLKSALGSGVPVVYLARTTLALPFGPDGIVQNAERTALIQRADAVLCASEYMREYCAQWARVNALRLPISPQPPGPYPAVGKFNQGLVLMINPCAMKGITIFRELARKFRNRQFGAVPTWGTTRKDLESLQALPNMTILEESDDIDSIYQQTQVLLVPSLWAEARGRVILEAMVRAIPVLASNVGGIPEAKLGVDYVLPVNKIRQYSTDLDERSIPTASVPEQNLAPWEAALSRVLDDQAHYEQLSSASRRAALSEIANHKMDPFEEFLLALSGKRTRARAPA